MKKLNMQIFFYLCWSYPSSEYVGLYTYTFFKAWIFISSSCTVLLCPTSFSSKPPQT